MKHLGNRLAVGWAVGWFAYMAGMAATTYDGFPSLVFQPIVGAVVSGLAVGIAAVLGAVFLIPPLGRLWRGHPVAAWVTAGACLAVMTLGSTVGITDLYINPETGRRFVGLHPAAVLSTYLGLVFVATHWPVRRASGPSQPRKGVTPTEVVAG